MAPALTICGRREICKFAILCLEPIVRKVRSPIFALTSGFQR
jgi:hypothetical protein